MDNAKTFVTRLFEYPSPFMLAIQALALLTLTSWISWILSLVAGVMVLYYFVLRVREIVKETPAPRPPAVVFISGASTGIGQALAVQYAKLGSTTIYVTARNETNLAETVSLCQNVPGKAPGFAIVPLALDVTDCDAMKSKMLEIDQSTPVDLVIANAGISPEQMKDLPQVDIFRKTYKTNIDGVVNTVFPLYDAFIARRSGHIVLISSIASFGSIAHPAYSSSKALVTTLAQGLRRDLKAYGVKVSCVCPGFILTNMTAERDSQRRATASTGIISRIKNFLGLGGLPFIRSVDEAAEKITLGLSHNIDVIIFPFRLGLLAWALKYLPFVMQDKVGELMAKLVYRGSGPTSTDPNSGKKTE